MRQALVPTFCLIASITFAQSSDLKAPPEADGLKPVFDGETLEGWDGDPRLWSVKDGVIHGETTREKSTRGNTFLIWTGGELEDFELRLSFRCNATNNSGVQYRSSRIAKGKAGNDWVVKGYQHEIRNQNILPSVPGFIYDERGRRGRICLVGERAVWEDDGKKLKGDRLIDDEGFKKLMKLDQWNDIVVIAKGRRIRHYLNGQLILDFTDHPDHALTKGVLALQLHGGAPMWTEFKDIRVAHLK